MARGTTLVAGASRNIGRAVAIRLAQEGQTIAAVGLSDREGLERTCELVRQAGGSAEPYLANVSDETQVEDLLARVRSVTGPVSVLVHAVAIRPRHRLADVSLVEWRRVMATNLESLFLLSRGVLPDMVEAGWGRIVGFSGLGARVGDVTGGVGSASKWGVEGFLLSVSREYASTGVTANVVLPGRINTAGKREGSADRPPPPIGRLGSGSEVAEAVAYFVGDGAGFTTGQVLHVTGGAR
jgi:3-oxoacyl-[acyl-carrier protein] reductase